ncbi:hypothetical protein GCM10023087_20590 [Microbacterium rhizosphaerae]
MCSYTHENFDASSPYTDFTTGALTYAGKGTNGKTVYSVLEPRDIAANGIIVGTWHTWKDGVPAPDHGFIATP